MAFWGWCCGGRLGTSAAELTREEVVDLFTLSTKVNEGRLIVHGLFARADTKNTNGRIYPRAILRREVARFKAAHVSCGSALGELNHPSYYSAYFRSLNLPNVSHQVLEVHWRGNELWGTIEVLPTPAGLLLWELYSRGIKLGVSSRGWASVVADPANNRVLVDDDFQLITFDFVTEPSNAGAYLVPIRTKHKKPLPDQLRAVRAAYLGFGSTDMANVAQLPAASVLSKWLKSTKKSMAAAAAQYSTGGAYEQAFALTAAALQQPPAAAIGCGSDNTAPTSSYMCTSAGDSCSMLQALHPRSCVLPASTPLGGGVVLGCHYRVLQEPWLPVDPAGREFKVHLSLVATKAHIMQQKQQKQQQRQQGKAPAAAGSRQQEEQQVPKAVVTLTPPGADADVLNTSQSVACAPLQQQKQQQLQAVSGSSLDSQQQQQLRQPPRASDDSQQQQQLHTKSSVHEALCTTSTTFSLASNISLGSQHLAAAREVLLCSASTDMSGCSLGPVVPPPAGHSGASASQHARQQQQHQHQQLQQLLQQQQQQQRPSKARRPQSAPGLGLSSLSSLQPRSWDWDRHTQPAHAAAARPSALQTVQVNWEQRLQAQPHSITTVAAAPAVVLCDGASPTITAASTINSTGSDTAAVGIPAAAGSLAAALPADAAVGVVVSPGQGNPGKASSHSRPDSASKQLLSQGCAAAAAEDVVHDSALRGSNDNLKPTRLAAWQDAPAQQQQQQQQAAQQQQVQDAAAAAVAGAGGSPLRQQPGSTLDEEYQEIQDTLQRYQSEYRRQRQHLKQEAANSH